MSSQFMDVSESYCTADHKQANSKSSQFYLQIRITNHNASLGFTICAKNVILCIPSIRKNYP